MTEAKPTKPERLDIRISPDEKAIVEKAASMMGLSSSAYVRHCVLRQAREDLSLIETITLSQHDRDLFLDTLSDTLPSNGKLSSAFAKFRRKYSLDV